MFNLPFLKSKNKRGVKPLVLVIMDGFGLAPPSNGNAITLAKTPNFDRYMHTFPHGDLIASGEAVGLPANEVGNTEVGHLTIGAGRVIFQDLKRINVSIEKGGFYDNKAFLKAAAHAKEYSSKIHLMGLVGSGNVHSSIEHLNALLQFCKKEDLNRVYLHIFTDGRDSPPQDGIMQWIETDVGRERRRLITRLFLVAGFMLTRQKKLYLTRIRRARLMNLLSPQSWFIMVPQ